MAENPVKVLGKGLLLEGRETIRAFGNPVGLKRHKLKVGDAEENRT